MVKECYSKNTIDLVSYDENFSDFINSARVKHAHKHTHIQTYYILSSSSCRQIQLWNEKLIHHFISTEMKEIPARDWREETQEKFLITLTTVMKNMKCNTCPCLINPVIKLFLCFFLYSISLALSPFMLLVMQLVLLLHSNIHTHPLSIPCDNTDSLKKSVQSQLCIGFNPLLFYF